MLIWNMNFASMQIVLFMPVNNGFALAQVVHLKWALGTIRMFDIWLEYETCCLSPFTADRAMREMNRKEKEIIKAYLMAVKYASQLESRVRIMLIGDRGSGRISHYESITYSWCLY